jgi:dipeptide/tripeptide permease
MVTALVGLRDDVRRSAAIGMLCCAFLVVWGTCCVVALGALLIFIGFVLVTPRNSFPGSTSSRDLHVGALVGRTPGRRTETNQRRRGKFTELLIGLGVIALGCLCIEFGS